MKKTDHREEAKDERRKQEKNIFILDYPAIRQPASTIAQRKKAYRPSLATILAMKGSTMDTALEDRFPTCPLSLTVDLH